MLLPGAPRHSAKLLRGAEQGTRGTAPRFQWRRPSRCLRCVSRGLIILPSLGWSFFLLRRPIIYEKTTWRPEGRPDTKSERWDWRREDQTAASLQIYDTRTAVAFLLVFTTCIARTDQDCASGSQRRALDPVGWVLISG